MKQLTASFLLLTVLLVSCSDKANRTEVCSNLPMENPTIKDKIVNIRLSFFYSV